MNTLYMQYIYIYTYVYVQIYVYIYAYICIYIIYICVYIHMDLFPYLGSSVVRDRSYGLWYIPPILVLGSVSLPFSLSG